LNIEYFRSNTTKNKEAPSQALIKPVPFSEVFWVEQPIIQWNIGSQVGIFFNLPQLAIYINNNPRFGPSIF
jgi:hypothetical protein